jgi:hypothetical protein
MRVLCAYASRLTIVRRNFAVARIGTRSVRHPLGTRHQWFSEQEDEWHADQADHRKKSKLLHVF